MKIRLMTNTDLKQIINLHIKTLPCTMSSKIGEKYLNVLYRKILSDKKTHISLVAYEKNQILGALTLTKNIKITQKILNPIHSYSLICLVITSLVKRKISLREIFDKLYFESKIISKFKSPYASILTLFVKPASQKQGVGKSLVQRVTGILKTEGVGKIFVDTLVTNSVGISFYKKMGFGIRIRLNDSFVLSRKI